MHLERTVRKMRTELKGVVHYFLPLGNLEIDMNKMIGRKIEIKYTGVIHCIKCGKLTRTDYKH